MGGQRNRKLNNNMENKNLNVSHPVPPNEYGIFMMHCQDNQPFTNEEYQSIIDGPIKAMEPELQEELSKVVIENRNDPEYTKYLVEKWSKCELLDSGSIDIKTCILLESVPYQILEDGTTIPVKD